MRFPSFPTFLRAFHTVSNTTSAFIRSSPSTLGRTFYSPPQRAVIYRSMPNIPFLGALFGSSSSMADNTNYPVQKPEGEWQTQLSPGRPPSPIPPRAHDANIAQSNSAFSARRAPNMPAPAHSTSTTRKPASTPVKAATRLSTKQTISSIPAAGGPPSGTPSPVPSNKGLMAGGRRLCATTAEGIWDTSSRARSSITRRMRDIA
jgi:hypothetical protein